MNWKRTLWILWAANFFIVGGAQFVLPFLPFYIRELGVPAYGTLEQWTGWVLSAHFLTSVIFQMVWGKLADRYGRKMMLIRAGLGMGIVTALMGIAGSVWHLLILRLLNGVFAGFVAMSISLQASVTPDEHAGSALGMLQTGAIAGQLIGPLIGGLLAAIMDLRYIFFLNGAMNAVAVTVIILFVHENRKPARETASSQTYDLRAMKTLIPVFIATSVTQAGMQSIEPIITLYAATLYSGAYLTVIAGLAVSVTGIANLVGSPTLGKLADRVGQRKVLTLALVAAALTYIPQAFAPNIYVLLVGRFMLGLFIGGMIPTLNVLVKLQAPDNMQAMAFGLNSSSSFLGSFIGPLIGGAVASAYGMRNVFFVTMAILLVNALMVSRNRNLDKRPHQDQPNSIA